MNDYCNAAKLFVEVIGDMACSAEPLYVRLERAGRRIVELHENDVPATLRQEFNSIRAELFMPRAPDAFFAQKMGTIAVAVRQIPRGRRKKVAGKISGIAYRLAFGLSG